MGRCGRGLGFPQATWPTQPHLVAPTKVVCEVKLIKWSKVRGCVGHFATAHALGLRFPQWLGRCTSRGRTSTRADQWSAAASARTESSRRRQARTRESAGRPWSRQLASSARHTLDYRRGRASKEDRGSGRLPTCAAGYRMSERGNLLDSQLGQRGFVGGDLLGRDAVQVG